jgi:hypothetical protein
MKTLFISNFPSGRWVATGQNGQCLTSECSFEKSLDFCRKNDTLPPALEQAIEFNWPNQMFQIPEAALETVEYPAIGPRTARPSKKKISLWPASWPRLF